MSDSRLLHEYLSLFPNGTKLDILRELENERFVYVDMIEKKLYLLGSWRQEGNLLLRGWQWKEATLNFNGDVLNSVEGIKTVQHWAPKEKEKLPLYQENKNTLDLECPFCNLKLRQESPKNFYCSSCKMDYDLDEDMEFLTDNSWRK